MTRVQAIELEHMKKNVRGQVLLPTDEMYESARKIWNGMIDKRPAVIVRCTTTSDVVQAVHFARESRLPVAVRGGGHNIAGNAVCDDGVVIDLSQMKNATVDQRTRSVTIEAGATLGDLDAATQVHGLATPVGINSTTGLAGLTLGGGFGWLSRKYGMTVDNLESAEVVTADGTVIHTSPKEHSDLFWALRGGGGNFGVVTRFEYRLHSVGPDVLSGLLVYPLSEGRSVLQRYREFIEQAPDELTVWVVLRIAPPLPFLPSEVHGQGILALPLIYVGDPKIGEPLIKPLRAFGSLLGEQVGVQPFVAWQKTFDPLLTPGARNYWKSHNFDMLNDELIDIVIKHMGRLPSPQCEAFFAAMGGATSRVAPNATAYAHRDTKFIMNVHGRWEDPAEDSSCIAWARGLFKATAPFASGGVYVNFLTADEQDRVSTAYGSNYNRLMQIKQKYDPTNLFCVNQNIRPSSVNI